MRTRTAILTLIAIFLAAGAALAYLGSQGGLPPALAGAYETVAALAASASAPFTASRTAPEGPDGGDAGSAPARRTTQAAPLSSAQLGAPLVHGRFVTDCGAPDAMKVVVKVTVKSGRAIAVAATTDPPNASVATCVEKATRGMRWDVSPKTQRATVTY